MDDWDPLFSFLLSFFFLFLSLLCASVLLDEGDVGTSSLEQYATYIFNRTFHELNEFSCNLGQVDAFCVIGHRALKLATAVRRKFAQETQGVDVRGHAIKWVWLTLLHKFLDTVKWRKGHTYCSQEQIQWIQEWDDRLQDLSVIWQECALLRR